jgi:leucyl aminopeptidase
VATTSQLPTQVSPPEFALSPALPHQIGGGEVWAFPVLPDTDGPLLGPGADDASEALGIDLLAALEAARGTGRAGEVTTVPVAASGRDADVSLVLLVGVGEGSVTDFRRAGAAVARAAKDRVSVVTSVPAIAPDEGISAFVVGAMLASFSFHWRSTGPQQRPVARIVLAGVDDGADEELARAIALGGAGWRSRALATVPANLKTPAWLADQAVEVGEAAGLEVTVWDEERLRAEGFGGILAVGGGSANPPRLIRMDYTPRGASRRTPTVVVVGKGITFDTGGLDIKPSESMLTMKRDMSGGGAVIAAMAALPDVGCPVRVVGLVPAAENAVSGTAMRPGDVITHFGGRTSEVNNTDAEGRLVLADAMAYAVSEVQPAALLDIATLTGAMKVALGQWTGGYFANHEAFAERVEEAATASGELVWRMPLVADYEEKVTSKIADGDNAAGGAGAITAALFLQHFAGDVPWAHVDFASAAESPADRHEWTAGPSGWGPRLLLTWLGSEDPLDGIV